LPHRRPDCRVAMVDGIGLKIISSESAERILDQVLTGLCRSHALAGGRGLYRRVIQLVDRSLVRATLQRAGGCQIEAARLLGVNRNTLRRKMQQLEIRSADYA